MTNLFVSESVHKTDLKEILKKLEDKITGLSAVFVEQIRSVMQGKFYLVLCNIANCLNNLMSVVNATAMKMNKYVTNGNNVWFFFSKKGVGLLLYFFSLKISFLVCIESNKKDYFYEEIPFFGLLLYSDFRL